MTNLFDPNQLPSSRYILPSFVEHSSYGVKESNPYNKLFEERIIFLGVQGDDGVDDLTELRADFWMFQRPVGQPVPGWGRHPCPLIPKSCWIMSLETLTT